MTTPEPPAEPTPPSFDKPAAGGSPYDLPSAPPPPVDPYYYNPPQAPAGTMPPLGGLLPRLVARVLDGLIFGVIGLPLLLVANSAAGDGRTWAVILIEVGVTLAGFLYEGLMLTRCGGRTLGKMAMGIRVAVLADGSVPVGRAGWIRAAVYWLPGLLSAFCLPALFTLLNVLWCLWDRPYQQCLHDKAARTVVVKKVA